MSNSNESICRHWFCVGAAVGLMCLSACTSDPESGGGGGQGGTGGVTETYPPGPYGVEIGSVIANHQFLGYAGDTALQQTISVELAHFYNPTGDGVFPEGSPYGAGLPIPKALNIMVAAQWVPTWWERELDEIIPEVKAMIEPQVGGFLLILTDGPDLGTPATPADLASLMRDHAVDYPGALDPSKDTLMTMPVDVYPSNILVRTADMTIVEVIGGTPGPDTSYWETFASVLNETP